MRLMLAGMFVSRDCVCLVRCPLCFLMNTQDIDYIDISFIFKGLFSTLMLAYYLISGLGPYGGLLALSLFRVCTER
jgi:hypothetical protein